MFDERAAADNGARDFSEDWLYYGRREVDDDLHNSDTQMGGTCYFPYIFWDVFSPTVT